MVAHQPYRTGDLDLDLEGAASELVGWIDDPTPAVSALVSACMPSQSEWPAAYSRCIACERLNRGDDIGQDASILDNWCTLYGDARC